MKIETVLSHLVDAGRVTPIGLTYLVEPKHNKTDNPFYDKPNKSWLIEKVGQLVGFTGGQYGSIVNNQRAREEIETDFEPLPLWNGKGIHVNKFIAQHSVSGKTYLKVMPQAVQADDEYTVKAAVQYRWKDSKLPLSESELSTLAMFEPAKSVSSRQETEKPVFWMTIGIDNIISIRFGGENYEILK